MSDVTVTLTYTPDEARRVAHLVRTVDRTNTLFYDDHDRLLLIASAIEQQIPKPKPAEPTGRGAVVEDAEGELWTRTEPRPNITGTVWTSAFHRTMPEKTEMSSGRVPVARARMNAEWWSQTRDYRDIDAVRVLSEGVTQ